MPTYVPTQETPLTVNHPPRPAEDITQGLRANSVADALRELRTFTREQVAWLMSTAMRWGYELRDEEDRGYRAGYWARVAEENSVWPDDTVLFRHRDVVVGINQRAYRAEYDRAARLPRVDDYPGGPVCWDDFDDVQAAA